MRAIYLVSSADYHRDATQSRYVTPGPGLTQKGYGQTLQIAHHLAAKYVLSVYGSPLERAWRVACEAAETCSGVAIRSPELAELRDDEVAGVVWGRCRPVWESAARLLPQHSVAIVTHPNVVRSILQAVTGEPGPDVAEASVWKVVAGRASFDTVFS